MGRAVVNSHLGEGLYSVTLDYGSTEIGLAVARIDAQIADRQADLADAVAAVAATDAAFAAAVAAADVAIDLYAADPTDERRQAMNAAAQELARVSATRRVAEARRQTLATVVLSLQADKAQLQSVRTTETRQAWCADYSLSLTTVGDVSTIEIPGEVGTLVISPGGAGVAREDGRLVARGAQAPHQAFYNAAILPGWQRFVHPYRSGTLTAKSGDTGTVNLDAAVSSAAEIQVRDEQTISAPIRYMTCDGAAFETGDRVVVDMRGPIIIGFESNPRACPLVVGFPAFLGLRATWDGVISAQQSGNSRTARVSGSLSTGQTTEFLRPDDPTATGFGSYLAECRNTIGVWQQGNNASWDSTLTLWIPSETPEPPETFGDPDPFMLFTQSACSVPSGATHYAIGSPSSGFWTYRETAVTNESDTFGGIEIQFVLGSEFRITSNDWGLFWSRMTPPETVILVDTGTEQQQEYQKAEVESVWPFRQIYRPVEP